MNLKTKIRLASLLSVAIVISAGGSVIASTKLVVPVTKNPIVNNSTVSGLSVVSAMVQDNVDPATGKAIADRLLIKVGNASTKVATGFEIYYTMVDGVTKQSESYYQKLTGFSVKPKGIAYLNFDGKAGFGHYPENKYSIYRSSNNEVKFAIILSANGFKIATGTAVKAKGTGEKVD